MSVRCSVCSAEIDVDDGSKLCPKCRSSDAAGASPPHPGTETTYNPENPAEQKKKRESKPGSLLDDDEACRQAPKEFGRYEILAEINRGAMGIVYRAREKTLGRTVALKVLIAGEHASEEQVGRFIREAKAVARLRHPNIVPIHDVGEVDGRHYFTMDYVEGEPLSKLITQGKVDPRKALNIIENVSDAVECAHQAGVVHRDVKPSNIMIDSQGRSLIMDFGLAKPVDEGTKYTKTGTTIGTPAYMPPEQARGDVSQITPKSDVYSLGAVLYELVTGVAPFEGPNVLDILLDVMHDDPLPPRKINPRIHADVQTIVLRAMEKDPDRRYQSAAEMRDDIRRFKAGEIIRARPPSKWRRVVRWGDRHRVQVVGAAGVLAVALVVAGAAYLIRDVQDRMEKRAAEAAKAAGDRLTRYEQPVWSRAWEDSEPDGSKDGKWEERASLLGGREMLPKVPDPYHGNVRLTVRVSIAEDAEKPVITCGLLGLQDRDAPVGFYGWIGEGSIRVYGLANVEQSAVSRRAQKDLHPLAERTVGALQPGASYSILFERRDMDIKFQVAGNDIDETLVVRNISFSNWRAKNLMPVLCRAKPIKWHVFRIDSLIAGKMDTFDSADDKFFVGEYNGARPMYMAIVESGRPAERLGSARLRLGMYHEVKRQFEEALRWYRSVHEYAQGDAVALEARLRQPFCLLGLEKTDGAAASILDFVAELASRDEPELEVPTSPWVWELAELARALVDAKEYAAAAEVVVLARPAAGWTTMDKVASDTAMGLAELGRAGDLLALADVCESADLSPAFALAVKKLAASDRDAALNIFGFSKRRFADRRKVFVEPATLLAKKYIADGNFKGVIDVHRTWPLDEVMATFGEAVGKAVARKKYNAAKDILAHAHSHKPEHDDVLRGLSISLAKQLCVEGRFGEVQSVFEAYPDPVLAVSFEEAARGLLRVDETEAALSILDFARRRMGTTDSRLAAASADVSRRFADSGAVDDALRVRLAIGAYPGRSHVQPVLKAIDTLVEADRKIDALSLFAYLRARLPEGDALLSEKALSVFEAIGSDPETRGRGVSSLAGVEGDLAGNAEARAKWLIELGDIACMVRGTPNRAEAYYRDAMDAGGSRATGAVAAARLAILADAGGLRDKATAQWTELAAMAGAPAGLAQAAKVVLGTNQPDTLARWQAEHPAEMSGAELALYLGLRALRKGRYKAAEKYFLQAREMVSDRKWPYHILPWLVQ